jgi:hypothetical protein
MVATIRSLRHLHRMAKHDQGDAWPIKQISSAMRCNTHRSCTRQPCV